MYPGFSCIKIRDYTTSLTSYAEYDSDSDIKSFLTMLKKSIEEKINRRLSRAKKYLSHATKYAKQIKRIEEDLVDCFIFGWMKRVVKIGKTDGERSFLKNSNFMANFFWEIFPSHSV